MDYLAVRPGCICYLPLIAERRDEPHATECPLSAGRISALTSGGKRKAKTPELPADPPPSII